MKSKWTMCLQFAAVLLIAGAVLFASGCGNGHRIFLIALDGDSSGENVNVFRMHKGTGELFDNTVWDIGLDAPLAIVVHPLIRGLAFIADEAGNVMAVKFSGSGVPTVVSTEDTGYDDIGWINGLAVSEDGLYLYSTTYDTDVVVWEIHQSTGELSRIGTYTTPTLACASGVAVRASVLYIVGGTCGDTDLEVATIGNDGLLTHLQTVTLPVTTFYYWGSIGIDPMARWLYVGDESASIAGYEFNMDGTLNFLGRVTRNAGSGDVSGMDFSADGMFLYTTTDREGTAAWAIDQETGEPTEIDGSPFTPSYAAFGTVKVDPTDKFVYASSFNDGYDIQAFERDSTTGALSPLGGSLNPTAFQTNFGEPYSFTLMMR
jgi:6-phosphogluconolactonase (cycloisomerase 2 family)